MAGTTSSRSPHLRFHAVAVVTGSKACSQVQALKNIRLLSVAAPRLPIVGCDRPHECTCRFNHYNDRRAGPRRTVERIGASPMWSRHERRARRGRRAADYGDDE